MAKKDLGVHTPVFTDALMDLVKSGAVTNCYKGFFNGKSLTSYALGTEEFMCWLDNNPLVEFQGIDQVFNPMHIGINRRFVAIANIRGSIEETPNQLNFKTCTLAATMSRNPRPP